MKALTTEKKTESTTYNRTKSDQDSAGHKHEVGPDFVGSGYHPPERFVPLVAKFSHPANATQKVQLFAQLQTHYGNRYVQRVVDAYRSQNTEEEESRLASEIISEKGSGRALEPSNLAVQRLIKPDVIQAKPKIGQPIDIYEQEANRVAEQVMRMPEPKVQRQADEEEKEEEELIQPKPIAEQITPLVQRQVEEEEPIQPKFLSAESSTLQRQENEEEEEETIQPEAENSQSREFTPDLESRIQSLKGGGQPLLHSVRNFFEPRFGYDFSQVRIHTDTNAIQMNRELNAQAFTIGRNIFFGAGRYNPNTSSGKRLFAHELTHVVQQRQSLSPTLQIQLSPDLRFGNRTRTLRIRWHGDYDVFRRRVRTLAVRRLEVPAAWVDQLLNVQHTRDLRSTCGVLNRADPLRRNGTVVVIQANYRAQRSAGASNLVFSVIQTPLAAERTSEPEIEAPAGTRAREETEPEIEAPAGTRAREEEATVPTTEERETREESVYQSSRELLAAFIVGTSLYELIGEPLHGPLQQAFLSSHPWTQRMRQHPHMENARENIRGRLETYCVQSRQAEVGVPPSHPVQLHGRDDFNLNTLTLSETAQWFVADILSWMSGGTFGQESAWLFGSFRLFWAIVNPICVGGNANADAIFVALDRLHLGSATRIPTTGIELSPDQPFGEGMPLNDIPIFWYWRERLNISQPGE
jgi:hypothetical protein